MGNYVGIRHEDRYELETRSPLTPRHVEKLVRQKKLDLIVQSSLKRVFGDEEYVKAGAVVENDLSKCSVIFGVKEIPVEQLEPEKTYIFFAHVIKGQPHNMEMLRRLMELKCNLIDYERIVDEQGTRLIFFGHYAGLAGMINSFWALGLRLKEYGYRTKLLNIRQARHYHSLREAREDVSAVGQVVAEQGVPKELRPFVIGFTGYGNVSRGAQEICGLLPVKEISPEKLLNLHRRPKLPDNIVYKVVFREEDMYERKDGRPFDLQDYFANPAEYRSRFEQFIPHLSVLINCVYWDKRYPRLVTKEYLKSTFLNGRPKLTVIGDISCDVEGSVECTLRPAPIDDPIYVYDPRTGEVSMGHRGDGMLVMAVDILPSELPRDSSEGFGNVLVNFVKPIADADFSEPFEDLDLPRAIKKGLILHNGELTPDYRYLMEFLNP